MGPSDRPSSPSSSSPSVRMRFLAVLFIFSLCLSNVLESIRSIADDGNGDFDGVSRTDTRPNGLNRTATPSSIENATAHHERGVQDETGTIEELQKHCTMGNFTYLSDRNNHVRANHPEGGYSGGRKIPPVLYQTAKSRCVTTDLFEATIIKWFSSSSSSSSPSKGAEMNSTDSTKTAEYLSWDAFPQAPHTSLSSSSSSSPPRLSYRFFDDADMDAYLHDSRWSTIFPTLHLALKCIDHAQMPVMKADIWRYLILWERGGIFADLDVLPHPDLVDYILFGATTGANDGNNHGVADDGRDRGEGNDDSVFVLVDQDNQRVVSQWFIAAAPKHPLLHYAVQEAVTLVLKAKRALPIQHTGPRALYMATDRFLFAPTKVVRSRDLHVGETYYEGRCTMNSTDISLYGNNNGTQSTNQSNSIQNHNHCRSFRLLPPSMAKNNAVREQKGTGYRLMNMTHYTARQSGKKYGGVTCLEFLNGTYLGMVGRDQMSATSFEYRGKKYNFFS